MGCQTSQLINQQSNATLVNISVVDPTFMKPHNDSIRKEMLANNIHFDYFLSLDCFFEEFAKRYYNKVVTNIENYPQLRNQLQKLSFSPNIYVILAGGRLEESLPYNVTIVESYTQLIKVLTEKKESKITRIIEKAKNWKDCSVKILSKPGTKTSEEAIFQAALNKANITYEFYNSYQLLEQSFVHSNPEFIVTDYIYHQEVLEMTKDKKTRVICYCTFDKSETYGPDVYSVSNNYLDITQDLKEELKNPQSSTVKCTKAYLYTNELPEYEEIQYQIEKFDIEIRPFNNMEKVIKETTYFFCVTVLAAESQLKALSRFFQKNDYLNRVKLVSLTKDCEPILKNLFKTIRTIKKGYRIVKSVTNSIDVIDKHYDNIKFQQIKKQLEINNISCHGYTNLSSYIKTKKFISQFIICNFEERMLLLKYMKQLQCKAKIIIFCNKNKIKEELKENKNFAFVSSHFGKIIKFIKKTLVYIPKLDREEDSKFHDKIEKIKSKNKRISALKWGLIETDPQAISDDKFQFLNIAHGTSNASIKDIQKTVSMLWKLDVSISKDMTVFKKQFVESLIQLKKIYKIQYPEQQFKQLLEKVKEASISQLMSKVKQFFEAENQLGVQINKSLINTENLPKNQIDHLKYFLLLVFLNYCSAYSMPKVRKVNLKHWMSNSLIEKCEVGSYLFCKNFLIAYEESDPSLEKLSNYKIEIQVEYNAIAEEDLFINSYITHKDKFIFCPFSQFQVEDIVKAAQFKIIKLKYIKNVEFLKYIMGDNVITQGATLEQFFLALASSNNQEIVDDMNREALSSNMRRCHAIDLFRKGSIEKATKLHEEEIKTCEEHQNLNSALINQLNYELACFYLKGGKIESAASLMKELINSKPGPYIQQQCELLIDQTIKEDENDGEGENPSGIHEEAMKTFVWLRNTPHSQDNSSEDKFADADQLDEGPIIFDTDLPCMEIDDIDEHQKENIPV